MTLKYHTVYPPAVFFDRDGTLNQDVGYISDPNKIELLPGVGEVIQGCWARGIWCFVVTNQSGIGRNMMTQRDLTKVNLQLDKMLRDKYGVGIHRYFCCPHHPIDRCECRKPGSLFYNQCRLLYGITLSDCWMVGDKSTDVEAGRRLGIKTCRLGREDLNATLSVPSLNKWWDHLLNSE
jgi:D-glycero-D-manno-heptose 1,7-bisphosphate phosphatase